MSFQEHIATQLQNLRDSQLLRSPRTIEGEQGPCLIIAGRPALSLCSNNYLGLANHPDIASALSTALTEAGTGSGASRHVSGSQTLHLEAQRSLASLVHMPSALLFSTGYAANVGCIQAVLGPGDQVFSDALNHASLIDGMRLSRAKTHVYRHRDSQHLETLLKQHRQTAPQKNKVALVVTDALFSMDGDYADLHALRELCDRYDAALMVDEAHSIGIRGPQGGGYCAELGIKPDILVGTLGKAFGLSGAFVAGPAQTVQLVENRARSYVFSTAPPPALAAATLKAVELVRKADEARETLRLRSKMLREGLCELGFAALPTDSPIVPVMIGDAARAMAISAALLEQGAFVHGIRPPTVAPGTSRLRVTTMATHTEAHIQQALTAFDAVRTLL